MHTHTAVTGQSEVLINTEYEQCSAFPMPTITVILHIILGKSAHVSGCHCVGKLTWIIS